MSKTSLLLLGGISILAFMLRTVYLSDNPPGFFCDEASIGYNAYSVLTTGKDEHGVWFPLFFKAFGEYKSPLQIYLTIPFIALFGLNEFSTRLPSAVLGTASIIAVYFLAKELAGKKEPIGLISAFLLAVSPWHIHFSRIAFEMMPFVLFISVGSYCYLKRKLVLASMFWVLAMYSYFPGRIVIPLFAGILLLVSLKHNTKQGLVAIAVCIILSLPLAAHMLVGEGLSRFNQVSVFNNKELTRAGQVKKVISMYAAHFSPTFLFTKGDIGYPGQFITRHSVRGMGQLYLWQAPFTLVGVLFLIRTMVAKDRKPATGNLKLRAVLILLWLLLYPLGSAFTQDAGPQATRSIAGVVPFQILTSFGLLTAGIAVKSLVQQMRSIKKIAWIIQIAFYYAIGAIAFFSFASYVNRYFNEYPLYSSDFWGWQFGAKNVLQYFKQHQSEYDDMYLEPAFNSPEIFLKFYDPSKECKTCAIGRIEEQYVANKRQLFAITGETLAKNVIPATHISQIYYPNGTVAFYLLETK